jgi:hypothetical protein
VRHRQPRQWPTNKQHDCCPGGHAVLCEDTCPGGKLGPLTRGGMCEAPGPHTLPEQSPPGQPPRRGRARPYVMCEWLYGPMICVSTKRTEWLYRKPRCHARAGGCPADHQSAKNAPYNSLGSSAPGAAIAPRVGCWLLVVGWPLPWLTVGAPYNSGGCSLHTPAYKERQGVLYNSIILYNATPI